MQQKRREAWLAYCAAIRAEETRPLWGTTAATRTLNNIIELLASSVNELINPRTDDAMMGRLAAQATRWWLQDPKLDATQAQAYFYGGVLARTAPWGTVDVANSLHKPRITRATLSADRGHPLRRLVDGAAAVAVKAFFLGDPKVDADDMLSFTIDATMGYFLAAGLTRDTGRYTITPHFASVIDFFTAPAAAIPYADPDVPDERIPTGPLAEWACYAVTEFCSETVHRFVTQGRADAYTDENVAALCWQINTALEAAAYVLDVHHGDVHLNNVMLRHVHDTPYGHKTWAYKRALDQKYYFLPPSAHLNHFVEIIDFGRAVLEPRAVRVIYNMRWWMALITRGICGLVYKHATALARTRLAAARETFALLRPANIHDPGSWRSYVDWVDWPLFAGVAREPPDGPVIIVGIVPAETLDDVLRVADLTIPPEKPPSSPSISFHACRVCRAPVPVTSGMVTCGRHCESVYKGEWDSM